MENVVFLGKTKLFRGKKHILFVFLLGASYMQRGVKMSFPALPKKFDFV